MPIKKFQRSLEDRRVAGLFGGLGEAFSIDPAYLRLAFILLAVLTGVVPALIGYLIGWVITPEGSARERGDARGDEDRTGP
jgi:phage shock protein C